MVDKAYAVINSIYCYALIFASVSAFAGGKIDERNICLYATVGPLFHYLR